MKDARRYVGRFGLAVSEGKLWGFVLARSAREATNRANALPRESAVWVQERYGRVVVRLGTEWRERLKANGVLTTVQALDLAKLLTAANKFAAERERALEIDRTLGAADAVAKERGKR